jgi:hypothetical protein
VPGTGARGIPLGRPGLDRHATDVHGQGVILTPEAVQGGGGLRAVRNPGQQVLMREPASAPGLEKALRPAQIAFQDAGGRASGPPGLPSWGRMAGPGDRRSRCMDGAGACRSGCPPSRSADAAFSGRRDSPLPELDRIMCTPPFTAHDTASAAPPAGQRLVSIAAGRGRQLSGGTQIFRSCMSRICFAVTSRRYSSCP